MNLRFLDESAKMTVKSVAKSISDFVEKNSNLKGKTMFTGVEDIGVQDAGDTAHVFVDMDDDSTIEITIVKKKY